LGPGPSDVHPRVLEALSLPVIGHLDPRFLEIMEEIQRMLRYTFQTENRLTIPVSGTGSAGMETAIANFVEPGDAVLICVSGYFGERMLNMAQRYGAEVRRLDREWGEAFTPEDIAQALEEQPAKLVGIVHGETSTGVLQPLEGIGDVVREHGALLVVDTVATLGGAPFYADEWQVDIAYSGSQKCLSVPPGLAPVTVGPRAEEVLSQRQTPVANWYLDLTMIQKYWGSERTYHHTAPINMNYALWEGLKLLEEEGLEGRWQRHQENAAYLWQKLPELGVEPLILEELRMPMLTTVRLPEGAEDLKVRRGLLDRYGIEIAGGLGKYAGIAWRIGLMGHSSRKENVDRLLEALAESVA
jgi:alanine-glyoxylate transaminase/serine-glyoxylate transaminase/serine-pyruvate transaminase